MNKLIKKLYKIIDNMTANEEIEDICGNDHKYLNSWRGQFKKQIRRCVEESKGEQDV